MNDWADTESAVHWHDRSGLGGFASDGPEDSFLGALPIKVAADVFAQDRVAAQLGLPFNDGATRRGDLAITPQPFADRGLPDAQDRGHRGLTAEALDCSLDCIHSAKYRHYRYEEQAHCLLLALPVEIGSMEVPPMHTGPELGKALKSAMELKKVTQKVVAAEFVITQPSVSEWLKHGRIDKKHLPHLVEYFSDVVGPEHWGMPASWGALPQTDELMPLREGEPDLIHAFRLLDAGDQHEIYTQVAQMVAIKHGPTVQLMKRLNVTSHFDDSAVDAALGAVEKLMNRSTRPQDKKSLDNRHRAKPEATRKAKSE